MNKLNSHTTCFDMTTTIFCEEQRVINYRYEFY